MVDLHLHSRHSDGSDAPADIVAAGSALGLRAMALTDHDTVAGVGAFLDAARAAGMPATSGVELSTQFEAAELHLLGYGFRPGDAGLLALLERGRQGRLRRNALIAERLRALGVPVDYAEVEALAGDPETVGRPHFAEAMARRGYVADAHEAFSRFLGSNAPAYVPRERIPAEEGIAAIRAAHGVAVWGHPHVGFAYDSIHRIAAAMRPAGLDGLEAYHSNHSPRKISSVRTLARRAGLLVTGGSDYHGSFKPYIAIGTGTGTLDVPDGCWDALSALIRARGGILA